MSRSLERAVACHLRGVRTPAGTDAAPPPPPSPREQAAELHRRVVELGRVAVDDAEGFASFAEAWHAEGLERALVRAIRDVASKATKG